VTTNNELGKYIVIEGADATGKSEQAMRISRRLQSIGKEVLFVMNDDSGLMEPIQEPGGVPTANELRKIIKNQSLPRDPWSNVMLFTAARRLNWLQAMEPALDSGIWVVAARSWISTMAYQGYGEGVPLGDIMRRTREDVGVRYMNPDLELIMTVADESMRKSLMEQRGPLENPDTFESLPEEFQDNMKDGYVQFAKSKGTPLLRVNVWPNMTNVEIEASKQDVENRIWGHVATLL